MQAIEQGDTSADNELIGVPTTGVRTYGHLAVLDGGPLAMREVAREVAYRPVRPLGWMTPSMRLAFLWMALRPWEWVSVPSVNGERAGEIAARLGMRENSVAVSLRRTRQKLRAALEKEEWIP